MYFNIYVYYTVMLRSTTGPYGRPVLEVAYGEFFVFHSTEVVWERIARKEWLGCQHVASPMLGIPRSTPVWAQLYYFIFWFYDNKITCIVFLKAIYIV